MSRKNCTESTMYCGIAASFHLALLLGAVVTDLNPLIVLPLCSVMTVMPYLVDGSKPISNVVLGVEASSL